MVLMYVKGRSMHTVCIAVDAGPRKGVVRRSHEVQRGRVLESLWNTGKGATEQQLMGKIGAGEQRF